MVSLLVSLGVRIRCLGINHLGLESPFLASLSYCAHGVFYLEVVGGEKLSTHGITLPFLCEMEGMVWSLEAFFGGTTFFLIGNLEVCFDYWSEVIAAWIMRGSPFSDGHHMFDEILKRDGIWFAMVSNQDLRYFIMSINRRFSSQDFWEMGQVSVEHYAFRDWLIDEIPYCEETGLKLGLQAISMLEIRRNEFVLFGVDFHPNTMVYAPASSEVGGHIMSDAVMVLLRWYSRVEVATDWVDNVSRDRKSVV